jgi:hypothetical protein
MNGSCPILALTMVLCHPRRIYAKNDISKQLSLADYIPRKFDSQIPVKTIGKIEMSSKKYRPYRRNTRTSLLAFPRENCVRKVSK